MSTFFDKLSGSQAGKNEINLAGTGSGTGTTRPVHRMESAVEKEEEQYPVRNAAQDSEDEKKQEEKEGKPADEEEGELTVDIYNKGDSIVIQSTVAGVRPEHLDVAITDDMVTIRGRRERAEQVKEDSYYYKELFWGTFSRQVILPEEIEQEEAEAHLQHGLLTVKLPKKRHGVTQKLKVKVV